EVAVEALAVGDLVHTAGGQVRVIKWLGHRRLDCTRHPRPADVMPVRVVVGAFGGGLPRRDLYLSPDHAVFIGGVLIPVRYLVNGASIRPEQRDSVTYWHVEFDTHDVLLAEGLPCESYLDTGNRGAFANAPNAVMMHPDFALKVWERESCARLVVDGAELVAARSLLLAQAAQLGFAATSDPSLRVLVDGRASPVTVDAGRYRVALPPGAKTVRLVTRSSVPAQAFEAADDHRRLGVAVAAISLDGAAVALADPRLDAGWHAPEGEGWRWTDGDGVIDVHSAHSLAFTIAIAGRYWLEPAALVVQPPHAIAGPL
ncbi:MAG: Hint domain-containing protein, partial [Alphaproteobacteria bacterium]|nr:Hint domain-containing protein [Alphaproteobacteria bacterium]